MGETKELITYVRRGGRLRMRGAAGTASETPQAAAGPTLHGYRATKQWIEKLENTAQVQLRNSPPRKEGRVHFKQENTFVPAPLLRKDEAQVALSPISLNIDHFSTAQPSSDGKILQQAVPFVRNEGGERKVVWCNPAFCDDSDDRRFSNESATTTTITSRRSPSSFSKHVSLGLVSQGVSPPQQQMRRLSSSTEGEQSKVDVDHGNYGSPGEEKCTEASSPAFSIGAVAGSSPATVTTTSTPEERGRSLRAQFDLESKSGNWYTPVMSSLTPESVGNSRCLDRLMMDVTRTRKTLAQMPAFKAASSSQAFFSSPAHPLCAAASPSMRDDNTPGDSNRRRPSGAYNFNYAAPETTPDCVGSERRRSRKLAMQQVIGASPPYCSDGKSVKSHKAGNRAGKPTPRGGGVELSGGGGGSSAQRVQGAAAPTPLSDHEAMVEADLEADIAREIEEEIAKEILHLSQKLADLHARQESRRVGWGEKSSKVGHSCPQTPLRCAPSPAGPPDATPPTVLEEVEKQRPASESKRRSGRVVAAKFLQSTTERKGVQSVDRSSRRRLLSDAPFLGPINLPRRSLGTPARLLAKANSVRNSCSPEQQQQQHRHQLQHKHMDQGLTTTQSRQSRSKVSAEEYVRERSSSAAGGSKSKKAVLKEVSRKDLEESRIVDIASNNNNNYNVDRQQQARSLSMGSAVQSRYFPEFERKIDWVKTLRSDSLLQSTAAPPNPIDQMIDDLIPRQICKGTLDVHTWLRENHGSVEIDEETLSQTIVPESMYPEASPMPVERCAQSNELPPHLVSASKQHANPAPAAAPYVARTPTPSKAARPWITPTRNTPSASSAAAAARSCSPSVRARSVPSRYGTPIRSISRTPGSAEKTCTVPKLVLESRVTRIDSTSRRKSVSREGGVSPDTRGRSLLRKPTTRKGYPGVAGLKSKAAEGGADGEDVDAHCSRHHPQHPGRSSVAKARDGKSLGLNGNECMKRKDNFEAEYERFVESNDIVEKQVSDLIKGKFPSAGTGAGARHTYVRCADLLKSKTLVTSKGKRATGQSVLPPTDGQESDDSVLARSAPTTESSLDAEEMNLEERVAEGVEAKLARDLETLQQKLVVSAGDVLDRLDSLRIERLSLPKLRVLSRSEDALQGDSQRDSGSVKRAVNQQKKFLYTDASPSICNDRKQYRYNKHTNNLNSINGILLRETLRSLSYINNVCH
ncbi:hypothetical protein MPTK1_6g04060 [Marchantia polymorpha subsp. ruderalis]|uniref:Uncharacterized protein n=2 Tax=Marchantia polymorpha TaxID=3197 RepID=A0AAF6BNC3_MARPO|nr:hypothetical protein MARPO_0034s0112 [Marchantia polymorpha]BBN13507.1 hypothetical protein Mp_6g04060 [Marchantia polymorpha subsp. ruderalis]|eukprot:PTQ41534.1 hypothetical protein MARPO_0034s0112 [Marchantia polymorpha]